MSLLRQKGFEVAIPGYLDGQVNIYYGVAPRYERRQADSGSDRGDAVNLATTLWLDEITCSAPDLPPFSWMVETSVGKVQAGYLLKEPTADIDRVEQLNQRLCVAVGGDNVWNRGRILRLPGCINLNHPGGQRARILEFHPDRRFTLDELDRQLPHLPVEMSAGRGPSAKRPHHAGNFNTHWPNPLPGDLQDRLVDFYEGLHLRPCPDGRYCGPCPLLHQGSDTCDCPSAFYASPVSGSWSCFCSDHLGKTSGTVRAFASLGFIADLSLSKMQAEIGKFHVGPGEVKYSPGRPIQERESFPKGDVGATVISKNSTYPRSDRRWTRGKRPGLWEEARGIFPLPRNQQTCWPSRATP